jgi:hypothetical protein
MKLSAGWQEIRGRQSRRTSIIRHRASRLQEPTKTRRRLRQKLKLSSNSRKFLKLKKKLTSD